jgi:antitoxin ParD1/3/4
MNKPAKPVPEDEEVFGPELSEAALDAWVERNREALNASLQVARDELARGERDTRTFQEIIAEGTRRHLAKR